MCVFKLWSMYCSFVIVCISFSTLPFFRNCFSCFINEWWVESIIIFHVFLTQYMLFFYQVIFIINEFLHSTNIYWRLFAEFIRHTFAISLIKRFSYFLHPRFRKIFIFGHYSFPPLMSYNIYSRVSMFWHVVMIIVSVFQFYVYSNLW